MPLCHSVSTELCLSLSPCQLLRTFSCFLFTQRLALIWNRILSPISLIFTQDISFHITWCLFISHYSESYGLWYIMIMCLKINYMKIKILKKFLNVNRIFIFTECIFTKPSSFVFLGYCLFFDLSISFLCFRISLPKKGIVDIVL